MTRTNPRTDPLTLDELRELTDALKEAGATFKPLALDNLPDLVAVWTGDVLRFDPRRDCAVILEKSTDGGELLLNSESRLERRLIRALRVLGAGRRSTGFDLKAKNFHRCNRAAGAETRVVILGDAEKFDNGEELHALTVSDIFIAHVETTQEAAAEVVRSFSELYSAGMSGRARRRVINAIIDDILIMKEAATA